MSIKRRAAIFILACGVCSAFAGVSRAQDSGDSGAREELKSLQKYGTTHNSCDGWSNGCALCARRSDGSLGCSRMGVDCEVGEIVCTQQARDPKTGKTPAPAEPR